MCVAFEMILSRKNARVFNSIKTVSLNGIYPVAKDDPVVVASIFVSQYRDFSSRLGRLKSLRGDCAKTCKDRSDYRKNS